MKAKIKVNTDHIWVDDQKIELQKKPIKNMYLKIFPSTGRVLLTVPKSVPVSVIRRFLLAKVQWLNKHLQNAQQQTVSEQRVLEDGERLYFWGCSYLLHLDQELKRSQVELRGNQICIGIEKESTFEQKEKYLEKWRRQQLKAEIAQLVVKWQPLLGVEIKQFGVRKMRTRWGSCNYVAQRIWLNLQLVEKPKVCLEYVVVHEMVHLLEKGHGKAFKAYMDEYLPEWQRIRKILNQKESV